MPELSCILLAGPNGSGKTSAFAKLKLEGVWINADEIAKAMPAADNRSTEIQAGRAALVKIDEMIDTRQSFIFETTLSSNQSLRMMRAAKAAGFKVGLYYVALDSVETNVERVTACPQGRSRHPGGKHPQAARWILREADRSAQDRRRSSVDRQLRDRTARGLRH